MSPDYPFGGYHQKQNTLPKVKKDFPRLTRVPSQVLQTNIRRLHDAWDFFGPEMLIRFLSQSMIIDSPRGRVNFLSGGGLT